MPEEGKEIRIWCDGCYDMVHFGHANSFRQAKALGHKLIVGVHTDEDIEKHKGPPVFTEGERYKLVNGIKWVDEVVEGAPYITSLETLDKYNCDFCAHGDDIATTADGVDTYEAVKIAQRYKKINRTEGISTTDLVRRILQLEFNGPGIVDSSNSGQDHLARSPWTGNGQFLTTTTKIIQFSDGKPPEPTDRIVYVAGAFDLFHVGHLDFLEAAKAIGDYLIVGLHTDSVVENYKGPHYPVMNINERVLSVLACKYVNEVIIGAPLSVTEDLMQEFKVDVVCHGKTQLCLENGDSRYDPYAVPKAFGKFMVIDSGNNMTTERIVDRIIKHRLAFEERNFKKEQKELEILEAFLNDSKMFDCV